MAHKLPVKSKSKKLLSLAVSLLVIIGAGLIFTRLTAHAAEPPWATALSAYAKRQKISLVNNSAGNLAANTTVAVTVNTKALYGQNSLRSDCGDLRVAYQPSASSATELTRFIAYSGAATCTTSENTLVNFNLQATLNAAATSNDYYIYYNNLNASVPTNTDNAFDLSSKNATLVCPFDGSSTCAAAQTPSTDTGTARYAGSKSAGLFDGHASTVFGNGGWDGLTELTAEMWVNTSQWNVTSTEPFLFAEGTGNAGAGDGWRVLTTNSNRIQTDIEIGGVGLNYQSDSLPDDGAWHHVALVYNGSSINFYIDGVPGTPQAVSGTVNGTATTFYLGATTTGSPNFQGKMDEFRISTIARYSSTFTPSTAPFVRDQFTQVLYHFDENGDDPRNTGKVLDDSGNGNHGTATSIAYSSGLVGIDSSTSDTGNVVHQSYADHAGRFIEEGTTNKFTNPSFENSGNHHQNWTNNCSSNPDNAGFPIKFGSQKDTMITSSAANCQNYEGINAGNTNTHTLSAYVYRSTTGHVGDTVDSTVAQLYFNGAAQTTTYTNTGGGWWRLTYTGAAGAGTQNYGVQLNEDSGTIQVDGVQLEEKAYATTYADGSLGTSYAWTGTANASTSTRDDNDVRYGTSGNIAPTAGSISFWVKPNWDGTDSQVHYLFSIPRTGGSNNNRLTINKYLNNALNFNIYNATGTDQGGASSTVTFTKNQWLHLVATWSSGSNPKLYLNNSLIITGSGTGAPGSLASYFCLSANANADGDTCTADGFSDSTISDLRIWDTALTSTEVGAVYNAGLVSRSSNVAIDRFSQTKGQNPVAIWHLNENTGTTSYDATLNGNNLTLSNTTWNSQPANRYTSRATYLTFNNSTSYATQANSNNFNFGTGDFTLTGWFQHSTTAPASGSDVILSRYKSAGYKVYMNTSGFVCFGVDDDSTWGPDDSACSTATQGSLADGKWHQFVAVKNGTSNIQIYIDNQLAGTDASISASSTLDSTAALYLGIDSDATSNAWDGNLDELVIYPYARSTTQIQADYLDNQTGTQFGAQPVDPLVQNLNGYWNMDSIGTVDLGQDTLLAGDDTGNQASVYAQKAILATTGSVSSISFGVRTTGGQLQLGIYDDLSNAPHTLLAHTAAFTPASTGFQSAAVTSPVTLTAGTYWIAYQAETSAMHYYVDGNGTYAGGANTFGSGMPGTFPTITDSGSAEWSIFASISTIAPDSSGNGNSLSANGGITSSGGKFGNAGIYNGSSKYFNSANTINSISSVSFWAKPASTTDNFINLASGDYIKATSGTLSAPGFTNPVFYVNGVRSTTIASGSWQMVTVSSSTPITANAFEVGRANGSYAANNSLIDDVRTYNRALTDSDVSLLYAWAPGPVSYWKFDEGSGTSVKDSSGNSYTGTWNGTLNSPWAVGKFGSAGSFNGTNNYVNVASNSNLQLGNQDFTVSTWVYPIGLGSFSAYEIAAKSTNAQAEFRLESEGTAGGWWIDVGGAEGTLGATNLVNNQWQFITLTRSGSTVSLYYNGVFSASTTLSGSTTTTGDFQLGSYLNGGGQTDFFPGKIDDFKAYTYVRTQKQITQDMNGNHPAPGSPISSAALYYDFDEGAGGTVHNAGYTGNTWDGDAPFADDPWRADGKKGGAIRLVNISNGGSVATGVIDFLNGLTGMTVSFWISPTSLSTGKFLMGQDGSGGSNDTFSLWTGDSTATELKMCIPGSGHTSLTDCFTSSGLGLVTGSWQHIVVVYDGTQAAGQRIKIYKNKVLIGGSVTAGTIPASMNTGVTACFAIGWNCSGNQNSALEASYDEFKIFTSALTQDQINLEYNGGSGMALGAFSDTSGLTGGSVASGSAEAAVCITGDTSTCRWPIHWWKLNENSGTVAYDSGTLAIPPAPLNNSHLNFSGDAKWGFSPYGSAALFPTTGNGTVDKANMVLGLNGLAADTFEAWIKRGTASNDLLVGWEAGGAEFSIEAYTDGTVVRNMMDGSNNYSECHFSSNDTNWHHVAYVFDGSLSGNNKLKGYLDGVAQTLSCSGTLPTTEHNSDTDFTLNKAHTVGSVRDVRIYNYTRTPAQIAWDMNHGAPYAWWEFDECSGNQAHDSSGNGYTGTITPNANTYTTVGTCGSGSGSQMWNAGTTGKHNSGLGFDGSDDYVDLPAISLPNHQDLSVSAWVKYAAGGAGSAIIGGCNESATPSCTGNDYDGIYLIKNASDQIQFSMYYFRSGGGRCTYITSSTIPINQWTNVTTTYDENDANGIGTIYFNGVAQPLGTNTCASNTSAAITAYEAIGSVKSSNNGASTVYTSPMNGVIDDLRLYLYPLTPTQVKNVYNNGAINFGPASGAP